jgi:hypothetical protein
VANEVDNCASAANPDQADWDGDGAGDACDADRPPAEQLDNLIGDVAALDLPKGTANSLTQKLQNALADYNAGRTGPACSKLSSFIQEVNAQSGKKIPAAAAAALIADAVRIQTAIGCG